MSICGGRRRSGSGIDAKPLAVPVSAWSRKAASVSSKNDIFGRELRGKRVVRHSV